LNLWKKRLGRVPDLAWEQIELATLILADNDLTELSERIGRLRKLRLLDLGHNLLTNVPQAIGELEGLSGFLYLHDNRLTSLPGSPARLTKLRYQNISENRFEELADSRANRFIQSRQGGERRAGASSTARASGV
jgi:Leucine-rich repeat (LRR) protein